jgi:hypothetical protein
VAGEKGHDGARGPAGKQGPEGGRGPVGKFTIPLSNFVKDLLDLKVKLELLLISTENILMLPTRKSFMKSLSIFQKKKLLDMTTLLLKKVPQQVDPEVLEARLVQLEARLSRVLLLPKQASRKPRESCLIKKRLHFWPRSRPFKENELFNPSSMS